MNEDTPTLCSLVINEPHVWSRLKIIYSFEYNGKWGKKALEEFLEDVNFILYKKTKNDLFETYRISEQVQTCAVYIPFYSKTKERVNFAFSCRWS